MDLHLRQLLVRLDLRQGSLSFMFKKLSFAGVRCPRAGHRLLESVKPALDRELLLDQAGASLLRVELRDRLLEDDFPHDGRLLLLQRRRGQQVGRPSGKVAVVGP